MNGTPNDTKPQRTAKSVAATVAVGVRLKGSRMAASGSLFLRVNALTSARVELTAKDQATRSDDGDVSPFHLVGERSLRRSSIAAAGLADREPPAMHSKRFET